MTDVNNRGFKGVWIPSEVWLNKNLSLIEKVFLVEIDSLDNKFGCVASNAHFAQFFSISKGRCSQIIKDLEAKNLIKVEVERAGKQITKRTIKVVNKLNTPSKYSKYPSENIKQGYLENDEGSNTLIFNNTKTIELFEEFWKTFDSAHGLKGSKKKALVQFKKLDHELVQSLSTILKTQIAAKVSAESRGEFYPNFPHVERWLRDERWKDEISTPDQPKDFFG